MLRIALVIVAALVVSACAASPRRSAHPLERTSLWMRYADLADARALALAGDPDIFWVAGVAAGLDSAAEAQQEAMSACQQRRKQRRMKAQCMMYAVGSKVVWRRPSE